MTAARVAVIGAGIAGAACAGALREASVTVDLCERGRAPGGRMASPTLHGRRVDVGAAYFTVDDPDFAAVVNTWVERGLARAWTDTLDVFAADGRRTVTGPMRWAARDGLRSLVRDLVSEVSLRAAISSLDDLSHDAVVLAMPDPQAARLAGDSIDWVDYQPVIVVVAGWDARAWPVAAAAFVNDDPDITLIADDGARRADGAPVLVVHTSSDLARSHLDSPDGAVEPVLTALRRVLGVTEAPVWAHAHRWTYAKPVATHANEPYAVLDSGGRVLGACGDSWCPSGAARIESAWLSGRRLGTELARRLS